MNTNTYRVAPLVLVSLLTLACCSSTKPAAETPAPPAAPSPPGGPPPEQRAVALANQLLDKLTVDLRTRLTEAMNQGGPAAAIEVCATEAQRITASVPEIAGADVEAEVGRSSLKLRNSANRGPDWVRRWLDTQGERPAEGVTGPAAVVTLGGKPIARVLRPIAVQGMCLTCHGPAEAIPPEVQKVLKARYPEDKATGYGVGALRGAAWAEVRID